MVYDVLSPDAFLRPYLDDYEALAALYHLIRAAYSARPYVDRELTDKTRTLLHDHTTLYNLAAPATIHELGGMFLGCSRVTASEGPSHAQMIRYPRISLS